MPRSRRHYRVTLGDAIAAHERAIARFGGLPNIHDIGLIESAVDRPYNGYHRAIHQKAAALLHAVAANHGFVDGNKRTALTLVLPAARIERLRIPQHLDAAGRGRRRASDPRRHDEVSEL